MVTKDVEANRARSNKKKKKNNDHHDQLMPTIKRDEITIIIACRLYRIVCVFFCLFPQLECNVCFAGWTDGVME